MSISITSTCAELNERIEDLLLLVKSIAKRVRDARKDMEAVSRELTSMSFCVEILASDSAYISYPNDLRDRLVAALQNCGSVTGEMRKLLEFLGSNAMRDDFEWTQHVRIHVGKLRVLLEAYNMALNIAVDMTLMYV
jgi:hypothetical protein